MSGVIKIILFTFFLLIASTSAQNQRNDALSDHRYRVIVSTDIGGSDPDDFQSMIHYLLYSNFFDTEGLISSPWGQGRKSHILEVIDKYKIDYPNLRSYSEFYPTPDDLLAITKQGAVERAPGKGYRTPTEGSDWIIQCAHKKDNRPLYILVWGLLEDVAQALHDDPSIQDKIRIYYIGGPNKKWGADAYNYIEENFPDLWMIENNSTYRGWYAGGVKDFELCNENFYEYHLKLHGALGDYFGNFYHGKIKMGDTPSVGYLLYGHPDDPAQTGWGGRFRPVSVRPKTVFNGHPTLSDKVEIFAIVEIVLNGPDRGPANNTPQFSLLMSGQEFEGYYYGDGVYKVRWSPKAVGEWLYKIKSNILELDGQTGQFTSVPENSLPPFPNAVKHTNWWTDILAPKFKEGSHSGAKTINTFRRHYLGHFAQQADRCLAPAGREKQVSWNQALNQTKDWYGSEEAIRIADNLLYYQRDNGGWIKNVDMARTLTAHEKAKLINEKGTGKGTTIDNGATHSQLQFLARVYQATRQERFKKSFIAGINYLLEAQYSNGGWPQYYPIREGYYQHITFNDDAIIGVMKLFYEIVYLNPDYEFLDKNRQDKVKTAFQKGLNVILKCQVKVDGTLTAWCAQHDEVMLEPAQARSYELPSLSGSESVGILEFLMRIKNPDPSTRNAIIAGCKWFENSKITGQRLVRKYNSQYEKGYDLVLEPDPQAPPLWARFYDIKTNTPIFPTRDGVPHLKFSDLTYERRNGYRYLGYFAHDLLENQYPAWKKLWSTGKHENE